MYNGIGLETVRGSGTNGYVQRNLSALRQHRDKVDYKSEAELKKLDAQMTRGPNQEILDHERKRKVELKCMEMQELMEEQGYGIDEIDKKVSGFRQMLMQKSDESTNTTTVEYDEAGRPIAKATHQMAEANQLRNEQLKSAFGIGEFYKEGSSFDKERKAKEMAAKTLAMAQAKYKLVQPESSESSSSESEPEREKKKGKRSSNSSQDAAPEKKHRSSKTSKTESSDRKKVKSDQSSAGRPSERSRKERSTDDLQEKGRKHRRD